MESVGESRADWRERRACVRTHVTKGSNPPRDGMRSTWSACSHANPRAATISNKIVVSRFFLPPLFPNKSRVKKKKKSEARKATTMDSSRGGGRYGGNDRNEKGKDSRLRKAHLRRRGRGVAACCSSRERPLLRCAVAVCGAAKDLPPAFTKVNGAPHQRSWGFIIIISPSRR